MPTNNRILVTGGAGFIGSALVRHLISATSANVLNVDRLTYASNRESLARAAESDRYRFERADICDQLEMSRILEEFQPDAVMHLAAESHVDRSIDSAAPFVESNIVGTFTLLEAVRHYWSRLDRHRSARFRFLHVSTDEVYGSLGTTGHFEETTAYDPRSPYSASKAAADHLVRAWGHTYGLPIIITNCSNNYGPYQFPEKLIPVVILNALQNKPIPVYGDGSNVRDWLFVDDHVRALTAVLERASIGETYNVGGSSERTNLEVVTVICELLDAMSPRPGGAYADLISFVHDRPGHDYRYAINASKLRREIGWEPLETFESGMEKTVRWYLENLQWCKRAMAGKYRLERLGTPHRSKVAT